MVEKKIFARGTNAGNVELARWAQQRLYYLNIHFARQKPIEPKQSGVVVVYKSDWLSATCPLADLAI